MIQLAILEEDVEYLNCLIKHLNQVESIQIVYSATNLHANNLQVNDVDPQVIVICMDSITEASIEVIRTLKTILPKAQILILTLSEKNNTIVAAIKAGAAGCMLKTDSPEKIINALYAVSNGESPLNEKVARSVIDYCVKGKFTAETSEYDLTKREKEILQLLLEGLSYNKISTEFHISRNTVLSHAKNIYEKVHVHSRAELFSMFNSHQKSQ